MSEVKHVGRYKSLGPMIDAWECSCGWESLPYFDGAEYAKMDFNRHQKKVAREAQPVVSEKVPE